jgi:hypothetical protein
MPKRDAPSTIDERRRLKTTMSSGYNYVMIYML